MCYLTKLGDITTDDVASFMMIGLVAFGVFALILYLMAKRKVDENSILPVNESEAKIVGKQPYSNALERSNSTTHEWVIFELIAGERVRLLCLIQDNHIVGDAGTLRWQGNRFQSFVLRK